MSVNRVYVVFGARVDHGFFTIRQKRIRGGSTSLNVTAASVNPPLSHCHAWPLC